VEVCVGVEDEKVSVFMGAGSQGRCAKGLGECSGCPESCRWPLGVGAVASMWGHKGGDQSPITTYEIPWMGQVCGDINVALQHGQGGWVGLSGGQGPLRRLWYLGGGRCGLVRGIGRWAGHWLEPQ
jgi:hypothetical protein